MNPEAEVVRAAVAEVIVVVPVVVADIGAEVPEAEAVTKVEAGAAVAEAIVVAAAEVEDMAGGAAVVVVVVDDREVAAAEAEATIRMETGSHAIKKTN